MMGFENDGGYQLPGSHHGTSNLNDKERTPRMPIGGIPLIKQKPCTHIRDLFALHADPESVQLAEDALLEAYTAAAQTELDPLTLRIKARYAVADAMLRIRGES